MLPEEVKNDIIRWISIGWEYQIIHKLIKRRHNIDVTKEDVQKVSNELAKNNAKYIARNL